MHVHLGERSSQKLLSLHQHSLTLTHLSFTPYPNLWIKQHAVKIKRRATAAALPDAGQLTKQSVAMFFAGAVLGPMCDAQHSRYDVLHYATPIVLHTGLGYDIETCWWVPFLFGVAGVILGTGQPVLDAIFEQQTAQARPKPGWPAVLTGITLFVLQYWASGVFGNRLPNNQLLLCLGIVAFAHWAFLDCTLQGLLLALLTSLCGPLIEVALINAGHLYSYSQPSFLGIPAWIGAVYFCGAPAVGNLGRKVFQTLSEREGDM